MDSFENYLKYQKEIAKLTLQAISRLQKEIKEPPKQRTSKIDIVAYILQAAAQPLHISEIIKIASRDFQVQLDRDSTVSNIVKKIKAGKLFIRTAPNTFALKQ